MDATTTTLGRTPPPPSQRGDVEWLTPEQVAAELQVSEAQLERWRRDTPGGPPWYRFGPRTPRYLRDEVNAWARSTRQSGPRADEEQPPATPARAPSGASVMLVRTGGTEG